MDTMRICMQCRTPLATDVTGSLCPNCQRTPSGIAATTGPGQAAPPTASQIAEFFPQLEIYDLLGFGGMGMVYKARQLNLDRLVALKILAPELSSQPAFAERFSREAKALARLHHSNIVSVYDFGRAGPYYYFLMEYVDGVDLHTLIQRKELKPDDAMRIVVEICQALEFAHEEGIIHRDIKPANILLDKKGRVKMADFGLAKLVGAEGQRLPAITVATGMMGTPQYMAPEQIERPSEVDLRADLYSLGVIFYEMLTGELPLGRFPLPSQKSHTDVRLDQVVLRALEKEPNRRYQRASEILTEVQSLSAPATAAGRVRKMAAIYQVAMACSLVLIAGLVYALVHRPKGPRPPPPPFGMGGPGRGTRGPMTAYLVESQDGLSLTPRAISELDLKSNQVQVANVIFHTINQDFTQIQRKYTTYSRDSDGHVRVSIKPIEGDDVVQVTKMRENLWKELTTVLTPAQLLDARKLPGDPFNTRLLPLNTNESRSLEFWKDNNGEYHSVTDLESARSGETIRSNTSSNINLIPRQYRILVDPDHVRGGAGI